MENQQLHVPLKDDYNGGDHAATLAAMLLGDNANALLIKLGYFNGSKQIQLLYLKNSGKLIICPLKLLLK